MNRRLTRLSLVIAGTALAVTTCARAELLFYEDFGTTGGELVSSTTNDPAGGWNNWYSSSAYSDGGTVFAPQLTERISASLSYDSGDGLDVDGGPIALDVSETRSRWAKGQNYAIHQFTAQTGDVYISFLMNIDFANPSAQTEVQGLFTDGNTGYVNNNQDDLDGVRNIGVASSYGDLAASNVGGTTYDPTLVTGLTEGATYFIVARYYRAAPSYYKYMDVWVNPTLVELTGNTGFTTHTTVNTLGYDISTIAFAQAGLKVNDVILYDEIRVGTELADVYPETAPRGTVISVK